MLFRVLITAIRTALYTTSSVSCMAKVLDNEAGQLQILARVALSR